MSKGRRVDAKPPGFFIPYRYHDDIRPISYPACSVIFRECHEQFAKVITTIESHAKAFAAFGGPPPAPRFEQDWFARLDLAACYSLVRERRPSLVVEVGSGHSTRAIARARQDGALDMAITCIDPKPRADLLDLDVQHIAALASGIDLRVFDQICAADILFIDSSHLAQPGTDVDLLLNSVVPRLPSGALIHIHDVFLPDPYPQDWAWRGYNEQSIVATMVTGRSFRPVFASHYVLHHTNLIGPMSAIRALPKHPEVPETSIWLEKLTDAVR